VINLLLNARDTLLEKAKGTVEKGWIPTLSIRFATVNAIGVRFATGSGLIEETAAAPGPWHRVTVRDNGMGMPEDVRERIFEPFYTTKEAGQGTGLGLATVWHLVKTMGGHIEVETRYGVGSAFHVSLPVAPAPLDQISPDLEFPVTALRQKFARILLVEDQIEVSDSLSRILERWGHRVTVVRDGDAALDQLLKHGRDFDLCITDMNMPGASGYDVVRSIRENRQSIRVVVMGGYLTGPVRNDLENLSVDAIMSKPFAIEDIEAAMRASGW